MGEGGEVRGEKWERRGGEGREQEERAEGKTEHLRGEKGGEPEAWESDEEGESGMRGASVRRQACAWNVGALSRSAPKTCRPSTPCVLVLARVKLSSAVHGGRGADRINSH